ncbi:CBS domain-containing protein [Heliorestis acidaminivorans]|uniref:CBS domain-containing protein n=1 Tax=Heliorestis acidaminivorans TaxID=553427 RepID=A0A6I0F3V5_9FIRM|nr:CBS domain-containing protein [Heliorestis acidaminivorans]KAB2953252.1 CBS domain-containing protein [Heliorestis acidaminivorans]
MNQPVRDIMTSDVKTLSSDQTLVDAAKTMSSIDVGAMPIVDNGKCVGIITDRDIVIRAVAKGQDVKTTKIQSVMTKELITASPDTDIHEAAEIMAENQIRRLLITDQGKLVGILALGDLAVMDIYDDEAGDALSDISEPSRPLM